jgi:RNA 3'-terminal phosphate cyclase (ATP)
VRAAEQVGRATVSGAEIGSQELTFKPELIQPGTYQFAVGTAGSATLVFQTILPALLTAPAASVLVCQGGTLNPFAPPYDFLHRAFAPPLAKLGIELELKFHRPGFYPAGGGSTRASSRRSNSRRSPCCRRANSSTSAPSFTQPTFLPMLQIERSPT